MRRYLQLREDSLVKALLLALQMSLSCCTQHPTIPMLWSQMLNRTLALAATGQFGMDDWHRAQLSKWRQHAQHAKGAGVLHLLARTCSVQQSGGLYRSTLRGHTAQVKTVVISPSGQQVVTASSDGTAQVGCSQLPLEWLPVWLPVWLVGAPVTPVHAAFAGLVALAAALPTLQRAQPLHPDWEQAVAATP